MAIINNPIDFKLGADPEFLGKRGNEVIAAREFGTSDLKLGPDGNGITFEVRPEPTVDPVKLVFNISSILNENTIRNREFSRLTLHAGSSNSRYPLGGHIHFGVIRQPNFRNDVASEILSHFVGSIGMLIEDKKEAFSRRYDHGYGKRIDYRNQEHGLEYRTLGSWLTSPYIATAMLCLSKAVVYEYLNNPQIWREFRTLQPSYAYPVFNDQDFMGVNVEKVQSHFPALWEDITKLALYQKYKIYIDIIYFLIKNKLTWFPKTTMREAWGLIKPESSQDTSLQLKVIWARWLQSQKTTPVTPETLADSNNEISIPNQL